MSETVTTEAPAAMRVYRVRGTTDEVTDCEHCGRQDLKLTVILDCLDEDGNTEAIMYVGTSCAATLAKKTSRVVATAAARADRAAATAASEAFQAADNEWSRPATAAFAAWVSATYNVPAKTSRYNDWPQVPDVPRVSGYQLYDAYRTAGRPGAPETPEPRRSDFPAANYRSPITI